MNSEDFEIEDGIVTAYHGANRDVVIPDGVTVIGECAFEGCRSLTSVTVPDSVTKIEWAAFRKCSNLTAVTIGNSVTVIEKNAFDECRRLTSVTIPAGVTSIGDSTFLACISLTSVTIPDSVTGIGVDAFLGCFNLTALHWVGRCNVTGITPGGDIDAALQMVEKKTFSDRLAAGVKLPFIVGMYRETKDADAFAYIKKNFAKIIKHFITNGDAENVTFLLEETELFTKRNIDTFIGHANTQEQHDIYTRLVRHKAEKLG